MVSEQRYFRAVEPAVAFCHFFFLSLLLLLESPGFPPVTPLTAQIAWQVIERDRSEVELKIQADRF